MDGIRELELENIEAVKVLYGELNSNLKEIENEFDISIHTRGNKITLKGNEERTAEAGMLMGQMYSLIEKGLRSSAFRHKNSQEASQPERRLA